MLEIVTGRQQNQAGARSAWVRRLAAFMGLLLCPWLARAADPVYRAELIFPLHPQHNHAAGIAELPDGELVASWYRGSGERSADDVAVWGSRLPPGARSWSPAEVWVDTPGFPDCNTCLHVDPAGRLWLFWPVVLANSWESTLTQFCICEHPQGLGAPAWSSRGSVFLKPDDFQEQALVALDLFVKEFGPLTDRDQQEVDVARGRLGDRLSQRLGWQPRCKPTRLPSGRMLLPLYSDTFSCSIMAISDDNGATWAASRPLIGTGNIQPSVVRREDGTLVAYMRENGPRHRIRVSESQDDGQTWGAVESSEFPNPGSGLDALRLANGHWLLVSNDTTRGRNSLQGSLSTDEGRTWSAHRHLEHHETGAYHYPAVIQSRDGLIHCVYSYFVDGGQSIKHAAFDEAWIAAGD